MGCAAVNGYVHDAGGYLHREIVKMPGGIGHVEKVDGW
jgi:hypothetical protein